MFRRDDVVDSFLRMLSTLKKLWNDVKFSKLKGVCLADNRLSRELKSELESKGDSLQDLFNILSNTPFCNWLNIHILKDMAKVSDISEATQIINDFEKCVYSKKCSEVMQYISEQYINPDHYSKVVAKLNINAGHITVNDLIKYLDKLESILQLPHGLSTVVDIKEGCVEIYFIIPCDYCLHTYEMAKRRSFKLRSLNCQYITIGVFSVIYVTNLITTPKAKSSISEISSPLSEISSPSDCKGKLCV